VLDQLRPAPFTKPRTGDYSSGVFAGAFNSENISRRTCAKSRFAFIAEPGGGEVSLSCIQPGRQLRGEDVMNVSLAWQRCAPVQGRRNHRARGLGLSLRIEYLRNIRKRASACLDVAASLQPDVKVIVHLALHAQRVNAVMQGNDVQASAARNAKALSRNRQQFTTRPSTLRAIGARIE